jgi:two-component system, sensor histidine kinase YesM
MSLLDKLRDLKIKHKLSGIYFILALLNVIIVSLVVYYISFTFIKEQSISILSHVQREKKLEIKNNLEEFEGIARLVMNDQTLQKFISADYTHITNEIEAMRTYVTPVLNSIMAMRKNGMYLAIIRYNNDPIEIIQYNFENVLSERLGNSNYIGSNLKFYHVLSLDRMKKYDWFSNLYGRMHQFKWMQVGKDKEYNNISLTGEMQDIFSLDKEKNGMIRISVNVDKLLSEESTETSDGLQGYTNFIFDENGNVLTKNHTKIALYNEYSHIFKQMLSPGKYQYNIDGSKMFFSSKMENNWTIITVVPIVSLYKAASNIKYWLVILDILLVAILLLINYIVINSFTNRLNNIARMLQKFEKGDFDVYITDKSNDEIGFLSNVFNHMVKDIKRLILDNYQSNIDKKDAELRVLQAQIKPHMLYNSLSTISRLADKQDIMSIKKMVKALCQYYRLSLNGGNEYLSIYEEIEHLKAYFDVYSIRKKNAFKVCYEIDEAILGYGTIKMILQPFVENIFHHAMYDSDKTITITLEGRINEEDIEFKIIDDGLGMEKSLTDSLFKVEGKGYGIKNVDERIKMHFGNTYGVQIFSVYGSGTTVTIRIPKLSLRSMRKDGGGENYNAKTINC